MLQKFASKTSDPSYQLIGGDDIESDGGAPVSVRNVRLRWGVVTLLVCFGGFGGATLVNTRFGASSTLNTVEDLDFSVKSGTYTDSPEDAYDFLESGRLVEPFQASTLTVEGSSLSVCDWSVSFVSGGGPWDLFSGAPKTTDFSSNGRISKADDKLETAEIFFPGPGVFSISLTCDREDGSSQTITDEVSCRYVRREVRQMSLVDREAFLDAFMVLYSTSAEDGVQTYGENFQPLSHFVSLHLDAAAKRNLDHIHDGLGLPTQHISLTMEFELAIQSVTPRLAVPYWDYTIDSAKIQNRHPSNYFASISSIFHESELFTEDFYGYSDKETHYVTEGRFSNVRVTRDYSAPVKSPRGFLRAPWNLNPSSQVTRFHSFLGSDDVTVHSKALNWPTCAHHLGMATSSNYDTWFEWSWAIGYVPHGPVHAWIGGVGGGDGEAKMRKLHEEGYLTQTQFSDFRIKAFVLLKNMWRDYAIETPKYCSEDAPVSECTWICVEDPTKNTETIAQFKELVGLESSDEGFAEVVKAWCDMSYWPGDHLEAASPIEASFWSVHPTIDRLLQYKDLVQPFTDKTWILDEKGLSKSGEACLYYSDGECKGHNAYDLTFWKSVTMGADGSFSAEYLTNEELRNAMLPTDGYALPYVYNSFEWKHCDELGDVFPKVSK